MANVFLCCCGTSDSISINIFVIDKVIQYFNCMLPRNKKSVCILVLQLSKYCYIITHPIWNYELVQLREYQFHVMIQIFIHHSALLHAIDFIRSLNITMCV